MDWSVDRAECLEVKLVDSIYKMHLSSFTKPTDATQPPIARVSRLVREETLPLFYHDMCLFVTFQAHSWLSGKTSVPTGTIVSDRYNEHLTATTLARFREVRVRFNYQGRTLILIMNLCSDGQTRPVVRSPKLVSNKKDPIEESLAVGIERHLSVVAREIASRPAHQKLHIKDFVSMEKACKAALLEH